MKTLRIFAHPIEGAGIFKELFQMNRAVLALIERDGRYLALPHRATGKFGFPGGKVDPGELPESALRRECLEEAGIHITRHSLLFSGFAGDCMTHIYTCEYEGTPVEGDTGAPVWVTEGKLVSEYTARFPEYNQEVFLVKWLNNHFHRDSPFGRRWGKEVLNRPDFGPVTGKGVHVERTLTGIWFATTYNVHLVDNYHRVYTSEKTLRIACWEQVAEIVP